MKICINAITPEGIKLEDELDASTLKMETDQIHYVEKIRVEADVMKDRDIVMVKCNVKSRKSHICSRCLVEFNSPVEKDMDFVYKLGSEHTIELDGNIRDSLMIDYPMKILCKDDCKGLCSNCGKDLNQGPCRCRA